jgi:hypothetical protein
MTLLQGFEVQPSFIITWQLRTPLASRRDAWFAQIEAIASAEVLASERPAPPLEEVAVDPNVQTGVLLPENVS